MTVPSYPQDPNAQNPYPQGAYPGQGAPAVKPKPPGTVTGALIIYVLAAIAGVVGVFLAFNSDVWKQAIAQATADSSSGVDATSLANTAKTVGIVVVVIFAALYLFFAFMMWGGRNWARIVLTVLSALSIASAFRTSTQVTVNGHVYGSSGTGGLTYVGLGLSILAIILMYVGPSNAYFRASKAFRKGTAY